VIRFAALIGAVSVAHAAGGSNVRLLLQQATTGSVHLPPGRFAITSELLLPEDARNLQIVGHPKGTTLVASAAFRGRALLVCRSGRNIRISHLTLDGYRTDSAPGLPIAPDDIPFAAFYSSNGILAERVEGLTIQNVNFNGIVNFAILVNSSKQVDIDGVTVRDSGSLNSLGRNNTTGGILLEEGTTGFTVRNSVFRNIRGNGVWTHSLYTSPRNGPGRIERNHFVTIGRDAIQAGHATALQILNNTGARIGYPTQIVDVEHAGTPVAIDTAGNVDRSSYSGNRFDEVNGKCIDLDGFHDGDVIGNTCINRGNAAQYPFGHYGIIMNNSNPDMQSRNIRITQNLIDGTKFGGIFIIGSHHEIARNRLLNLNLARCNESATQFGCLYDKRQPDLLQAGIYLGQHAERLDPARENIIRDNLIQGHEMEKRCILAAPGIEMRSQRIEGNECRNSR
jgi:hypothetical protein